MDFTVFIPVLDALSHAMEAIPNPWIAAAGVVLAGVVFVWRKAAQGKAETAQANQKLAEVISIKAAPAPTADTKTQEILDKTLKGDKTE